MGPRAETANVVLIGMPGSGKSTLGVLLAKALSRPFLDTDICIQTQEGKSLQQILDERGIPYFLRLEESFVLSLDCSRHVVATGGSVVYSARAMEHLKKNGILFSLDVSLPVLKQRIRDMESRGVVLAPGQDLAELYAERMPLYEQHGDIRIPCDGKGHEEVIRQILRELAVWRIP